MSAVEYKCPVCGARMFTEPDSPIEYHCPNEGVEFADGSGLHPEAIMLQTEEYIGPNFLYKGEGEVNPAKTGIITPGVGGEGANATVPVLIRSEPKFLTEEEELEELRAMWHRITGHPADRRLKAPRLRQEIEGLEHSLNERLQDEARQEAEAQEEAARATMRAELLEEVRAEVKSELIGSLKDELLAEIRAEMEQGNGNSE